MISIRLEDGNMVSSITKGNKSIKVKVDGNFKYTVLSKRDLEILYNLNDGIVRSYLIHHEGDYGSYRFPDKNRYNRLIISSMENINIGGQHLGKFMFLIDNDSVSDREESILGSDFLSRCSGTLYKGCSLDLQYDDSYEDIKYNGSSLDVDYINWFGFESRRNIDREYTKGMSVLDACALICLENIIDKEYGPDVYGLLRPIRERSGSRYSKYEFLNDAKGIHVRDGIYKVVGEYLDTIENLFSDYQNNHSAILYTKPDNDSNLISVKYFIDEKNKRSMLYNALNNGEFEEDGLMCYIPKDDPRLEISSIF